MVVSLLGQSGVNALSHVVGDINHVNVSATHLSHHVEEKIVQHLVILMNYKLV